jgi:hypothetical protein
MPDHKRRDSLIPTMHRRAMHRREFLATMGVAAGSIVMGTRWPPGMGRPACRAAFKLSAPEPHPKYGGPYATVC